jgi:diaminohydroxyphosphoribosylaminopyrimidine deaminase/5-amino-6-(5-phosphoribosylamino)uracil reductase
MRPVTVRRTEFTEDEFIWMRRAVDTGKRSVAEDGRSKPPPKVGVVIVQDGELVGESFRGDKGSGLHAEYGLLESLNDRDLVGATVYTTLEPCSHRNPPKRPCAEYLIERGVAAVFIGMYDPNPVIYRAGWKKLRDAGVTLRDFDTTLREEIWADNKPFIDVYRLGMGAEGDASFDYAQNDGRFEISTPEVTFRTRWTQGGKQSIYAYDSDTGVAHARYAATFDEVDDPGSLDFASHSRLIREGEIVVFRNGAGFALLRVDRVLSGNDYGDDHTELSIHWQLRLK